MRASAIALNGTAPRATTQGQPSVDQSASAVFSPGASPSRCRVYLCERMVFTPKVVEHGAPSTWPRLPKNASTRSRSLAAISSAGAIARERAFPYASCEAVRGGGALPGGAGGSAMGTLSYHMASKKHAASGRLPEPGLFALDIAFSSRSM